MYLRGVGHTQKNEFPMNMFMYRDEGLIYVLRVFATKIIRQMMYLSVLHLGSELGLRVLCLFPPREENCGL